jgi:hypothetical protein
MIKLAVTATALVALALAPAASAGCWATVKLSSMPTSARTWNVTVQPLQHGFRSLPAAKPRVEIRKQGATKWIVFRPEGRLLTGLDKGKAAFRFHVVFPGKGTYSLRIWDGFEPTCARYHSYAAVDIT